ncbi:MAG: sulfotransferase [Candidatus Aminicenantes bacterium]|nr:MAG: sulfotransferase [Candidatus Aminicenantes bacterium]
MKNVLILGSGRSGTSMAAGILSKAGYYMGENLMPATHTNPKGFFESFDIEQINEDILRKVVKKKPLFIDFFLKKNLAKGHYWLAKVSLRKRMKTDEFINQRIRKEIARAPFCFKDPRFSYTLPIWRPFLPKNTVFLCIFRHPTATAKSILKQIQGSRRLEYLRYNFSDAMKLWKLMYSHILYEHSTDGDWLFLHYDQLLEEEGLNKIQRFTNAVIDKTFPEKRLNRSLPDDSKIPDDVGDIYHKLCKLAGVS